MSESERDKRVRRHEEVVGRLIRTILSRQRELNTLRDLKDQLFRGDISEQAVLSLLDSQVAPKRSLPEDYICIAPDEMPLVIEYLCGTGADSDTQSARIHLGLCARCTEMEKVIGKAATRMRDRCVGKVREHAELCRYGPHDARNELLDVMGQLQSLTLEQGEQEKSK